MMTQSFNKNSLEVLYLGGDFAWTDPDQAIEGGGGASYLGIVDDEQSMRGLCYYRFNTLGPLGPRDVVLGVNLGLEFINPDGVRLLRVFCQPTFNAGTSLAGSSYINNAFVYEDGNNQGLIHPSPTGTLWGLSASAMKAQLTTNITNFGFVVQITQINGEFVTGIIANAATLYVSYSTGGSPQKKYLKSLSSILTPT